MNIAERNRRQHTVGELCDTLGISRSTWYRSLKPRSKDTSAQTNGW